MFTNVDDLLDALGGTCSVAKALKINKSVVSTWRARRRIPADNWRGLLKLARKERVGGINLEVLEEFLHTRRRKKG